MTRLLFGALTVFLLVSSAAAETPETLKLNLRAQAEIFKGRGPQEVTTTQEVPANKAAIVICDMWDDHWCQSAAKRCAAMAPRMAAVVDAARARGVKIIHAPSDCMDYYKDAPQRKAMANVAKVELPKPLEIADCPLPIDDKEGGCDDAVKPAFRKAWTRQHAALTIADGDLISDKGDEVYSYLKNNGITHLFIMGVHTNMCILNRKFAIKQMTRWGINCVLVRDLTDSMYDPRKSPMVAHDLGTALVINYIETNWCPSILSKDLTGK